MSSACACHEEGAFCFYCEVYSPVVAENERLRSVIMGVYQRARNDVARREGGQCVGTVTFADYPFAKRLVREMESILFPEVEE